MTELPEYYFRIRENDAAVFRISTDNRQRRIEMEEIAIVNIRNGNIRPHGERALSDDETAIIEEWGIARRAVLAERYRRHPPRDRPPEPDDALGAIARKRYGSGGCDRSAFSGHA